VQSDAAKAIVLWWALLAFIGSGFEHSIANMTIFGLGILEGSASAGQLARNLAWTVPGNIVGGGLLVGLAYAWIGRPGARTPSVPEPVASSPPPAPVLDPGPVGAPAPAYARTGATA
jgi:nitrite transporter NirC